MTKEFFCDSVGDNTVQLLLPILEVSLTQPTLNSQYYRLARFPDPDIPARMKMLSVTVSRVLVFTIECYCGRSVL